MASPAALAACKAVAAVLFALVALGGACVPFALKRCNVSSRIMYLNAFAGGAFLALGILHIMPEAIELLDELEVYIHLNGKPFAVTHLLIFLGYLIVLFCEEVLSRGTSHSSVQLEALPEEGRKEVKGSCTSKSTQSVEEQEPCGPLYAIECHAGQELPVISQGGLAVAGEEQQVSSSSSRSSSRSSSSSKTGGSRQRTFDSGAFFMMLALGIHGLFEGAIVGAAGDLSMMWMISAVVLGHKWAEAMLLMCQMLERRLSLQATVVLMGAFVASSPLGVVVGFLLAADGRLASGICNALGAGTVLYIAGEISTSAFQGCRKARFAEFLTYCSGAALVLGLTLLDVAYGRFFGCLYTNRRCFLQLDRKAAWRLGLLLLRRACQRQAPAVFVSSRRQQQQLQQQQQISNSSSRKSACLDFCGKASSVFPGTLKQQVQQQQSLSGARLFISANQVDRQLQQQQQQNQQQELACFGAFQGSSCRSTTGGAGSSG
ncbi:hypothetical protein Efla_003403 [Eimeria flavescens]